MSLVNPRALAPLLLTVPLALGAFGCVYDDDPPRRLVDEHRGDQRGGAGSSEQPTAPTPMLVEVDADQTMSAVGGDGVGVFIEYGKGGHWHLTWTCDTSHTAQSCDFVIRLAAASGTIANVDEAELPAGAVRAEGSPSAVEVRTTTSTELHSVRFDTNPGAVLTVDASVGGLKDGAFLFFVQDGKVNGGFTGRLTNPLQLQGNTP